MTDNSTQESDGEPTSKVRRFRAFLQRNRQLIELGVSPLIAFLALSFAASQSCSSRKEVGALRESLATAQKQLETDGESTLR